MRIPECLVEINAPAQIPTVPALDPIPIGFLQALKTGVVRVGQTFGPGYGVLELHKRIHFDELLTTSATTSPTCPLNSVSPPQPAIAASSEPGSRSEISFVSPDLGSK
jgi:hypothetical protein